MTQTTQNSGSNPFLYGSDMIGRTYDVKNGRLADAESLLPNQLFNLSPSDSMDVTVYGTTYACPSSLTCTVLNESTLSASSTQTYTASGVQNNFNVDLGVSGVSGTFSGEINAGFAYSSSSAVSANYYTSRIVSQIKSYNLEISPDNFSRLLNSSAAEDINNMDPNELVRKYGTHFLRAALFGGSWMFVQSVSTASCASTQEAEASVSASYESVSGSIGASSQTFELETSTQSNALFQAIGGDTSVITGGVDAWSKTVPGNFALTAFKDGSGNFAALQPISVLAQTPERRAAIEDAIRAYLTGGFSSYDVVWDDATPTYYECDYQGARTQTSSLTTWGEATLLLSNVNEIITGIGFNVEDNNVTHLGAKVLNLKTGERYWLDDKGSSTGQYEQMLDLANLAPNDGAKIKQLYTVVGLGGSCSKNEATGLMLYYQTLNFTDNGTGYISSTVGTYGGGEIEVQFAPNSNAKTVVVGISMRANGGVLKNLSVKLATLKSIKAA